MKRIGNLYEKVCSIENLQLADEKARKGKLRTYGVIEHDKKREVNLLKLRETLLNGTFHTSKYDVFTIYEPKEREIYRLPYFPDRILHHAIMNVLEPIWVSTFTADTYSCIKNRGIHAAAKKVKQALREDPEGTTFCLKLDIRKFYPSINHDVLKSILRRKLKDKRLLRLLDEIIDSADGVPIGNYLSQYFANLYLTYFDHWIKEQKRVKHYFRYADDIVILASDKSYLHSLMGEIRAYLGDLKLEGHRFRLHSDPRPCRRRRLTKSNTCRLRLVVHRRARNPLQACIPQIRAFGSLQRQKPKDKLSSGAPSSSLAQLQRFRRKGFRPESFWAQRQGTIVQRFRSPRQVTEMLLP